MKSRPFPAEATSDALHGIPGLTGSAYEESAENALCRPKSLKYSTILAGASIATFAPQ
jgi:hypothetical protein